MFKLTFKVSTLSSVFAWCAVRGCYCSCPFPCSLDQFHGERDLLVVVLNLLGCNLWLVSSGSLAQTICLHTLTFYHPYLNLKAVVGWRALPLAKLMCWLCCMSFICWNVLRTLGDAEMDAILSRVGMLRMSPALWAVELVSPVYIALPPCISFVWTSAADTRLQEELEELEEEQRQKVPLVVADGLLLSRGSCCCTVSSVDRTVSCKNPWKLFPLRLGRDGTKSWGLLHCAVWWVLQRSCCPVPRATPKVETQFFAMLMAGVVLANSVVIGSLAPLDSFGSSRWKTLPQLRLGAGTDRKWFNLGVLHHQQWFSVDLHVQLGKDVAIWQQDLRATGAAAAVTAVVGSLLQIRTALLLLWCFAILTHLKSRSSPADPDCYQTRWNLPPVPGSGFDGNQRCTHMCQA